MRLKVFYEMANLSIGKNKISDKCYILLCNERMKFLNYLGANNEYRELFGRIEA